MFSTTTKQIFGGASLGAAHKTSKSSYENTSVHTAYTTALTQSNVSTVMQQRRAKAAALAKKPNHYYDPLDDIQKAIPRQPQRLNEVSYRFALGDRKHSNQS